MAQSNKIKCSNCRSVLLDITEYKLLDAHSNDLIYTEYSEEELCHSIKDRAQLFLDLEHLPDFIQKAVAETGFTTGRVACPTCGWKIGSFSFINGSHCACSAYPLPPVHLTSSRVDFSLCLLKSQLKKTNMEDVSDITTVIEDESMESLVRNSSVHRAESDSFCVNVCQNKRQQPADEAGDDDKPLLGAESNDTENSPEISAVRLDLILPLTSLQESDSVKYWPGEKSFQCSASQFTAGESEPTICCEFISSTDGNSHDGDGPRIVCLPTSIETPCASGAVINVCSSCSDYVGSSAAITVPSNGEIAAVCSSCDVRSTVPLPPDCDNCQEDSVDDTELLNAPNIDATSSELGSDIVVDAKNLKSLSVGGGLATELVDYPDHLICPICLELLFSPFSVKPCGHVFCEPCLRRLARPAPTNTSCPLCREIIGACQPACEYSREVRQKYPKQVAERHKFEQSNSAQHLPLPWLQSYRFLNFDRGMRHPRTNVHARYSNWWRTALWIFWVDAIGFILILTLNWFLSQAIHSGEQQQQQLPRNPHSRFVPSGDDISSRGGFHMLLDGSGDGGAQQSSIDVSQSIEDTQNDWSKYRQATIAVGQQHMSIAPSRTRRIDTASKAVLMASTDFLQYHKKYVSLTDQPVHITASLSTLEDSASLHENTLEKKVSPSVKKDLSTKLSKISDVRDNALENDFDVSDSDESLEGLSKVIDKNMFKRSYPAQDTLRSKTLIHYTQLLGNDGRKHLNDVVSEHEQSNDKSEDRAGRDVRWWVA